MDKSKAILMIDYENLYCGANEHGLSLTDKGLHWLVSYFRERYEIDDDQVLIACRYTDYVGLAGIVESQEYVKIDALEKMENIADAYLIARGTKELYSQEGIKEVILIAGDGIYSSFIRTVSKDVKRIQVVSWKNSMSDKLSQSSKKVETKLLEEVFQVSSTDKSPLIADGRFEPFALSPIEEAIIGIALTGSLEQGWMMNALGDLIKTSTNTTLKNHFKGDFKQIVSYLRDSHELFEIKKALVQMLW